jgi:ABC-2 type transport system permease protein
MGMPLSFTAIYLVGSVISCSMFEIQNSTILFISDLEGNNKTSYQLTMPIPSHMIIVKNAILCACKGIIFSSFIIPIGKLFLGSRIIFPGFSFIKFIIIFISIHMMSGALHILTSSITKNLASVGDCWMRFLFPLWFLGGTSFPWHTVYKFSPKIAYLFLLNPVTFASEGIRAVTLGQKEYLSFWLCTTILWTTTIFFGIIAIKMFKKRLNYI